MLNAINIPIQTINCEFFFRHLLNKSNMYPIILYYKQIELNVIITKLCKNNDTFFA